MGNFSVIHFYFYINYNYTFLTRPMDLKIALCTIYNDNILDIKEWVEWNKNIGISKIFIYENNINDKKYESINDYISESFVEVINIKNINNEINDLKSNCFIDFYEGQGKDYDWICFFDINDFLMFNDNLDLFSFLDKKEFINQDLILVSLENHNHFVKSIVRSGRQILDKFQDNLSSVFRLKNDNTIYSAGLRLRDKRNHYDISNRIHRLSSCYIDNRYQAKIKENELKIALCAIAKNENLYIREWVEWYKNLGISKIFLYDNNDIDGERFEEVINDYIESGFVEIKNWRGIVKSVKSDKDGQSTQGLVYSNCYYNNYKKYDWICFFDIDEYLEIYYKYNNLNDFLNDFNNYDGVKVQWKMYGDNGYIYFQNKPLLKRFKSEKNSKYDRHVKQIINCNSIFDEPLLFCAHGVFNKKYNFVNTLKQPLKNTYLDNIAHSDLPIYLNHFYSKSTEEFFNRKYNKPSAVTGINDERNFNIEFLKTQYFKHNKRTEEKEQYINTFISSNNSVNVYMASLYKDGHVIDSIKSIINQPQVKSLTLSANNYTNEQYQKVINEINSDKLIIYRTKNEKLSFEKLRYVNNDKSTKYVAFCDDDLIYYNGYFAKMINECEKLNAVVSYHGSILKQLPIKHYYPDRKSFSFNREVKENKEVDIIGNGVSLFKRDWITYKQWKDLYNNAPEVSMDDITISYILRKNGKKLVVVKHSIGDVIERINNKLTDTVYNLYKKNDSVQTDWVNKYFIEL